MDRYIGEKELAAFERHLRREEREAGTIEKYLRDVRALAAWLDGRAVDKGLAVAWKERLVAAGYAAATVNSMVVAANQFFRFQRWEGLRVKTMRLQRRMFRSRERELTKQEYVRLLETAQGLGRERLALLMEAMCATGIRVSEVRYALPQPRLFGVVEGKILRNRNPLGAALHAVPASGTGDGRDGGDDLRRLCQRLQLHLPQGLRRVHDPGVLLQLGHGGHPAEDHHDVLQAGGKAERPLGRGPVGVDRGQDPGRLLRQLGQPPALYRLHHRDLFPVLYRRLIAPPGLDAAVLPVQVVELELHQLHLRVLRQDLVQDLRRVVEGEAQTAEFPGRLLLPEEGEAAQPLGRLVGILVDIVEEVPVEIVHAALLELLVEDPRLVLLRPVLEQDQGQLVRQSKALPRVPVYQAVPDNALALLVVVHIGGVEVGEPPLQEGVHHFADLLHVHHALDLGVQHGQAHHAKA